MASNWHAPEGPYDPYPADEESGRYGEYGEHGEHGPHRDEYGGYDTYGSQLTEPYGADGPSWFGADDTDGTGIAYATQASQAPFEAPESSWYAFGPGEVPPVPGPFDPHPADFPADFPADEWNPTEESVRPVRGRHKLPKQRGGSKARSTVLGVGIIAAVGAGGMASAQEKPATSISMKDVTAAAVKAKDLPGVNLIAGGSDDTPVAGQPLTQAALTRSDTDAGRTDAGEALRSRILKQAEAQQFQADASERAAAVKKASDAAESKAAKAKNKAAALEKQRAEEARLAQLAKSYKLPVSGYQLTSSFGESGSLWANGHTGQDFAAPSGTPIRAVHTGTIKEAGPAGSFGNRTILKLDDGTELWFCHQSSMNVSVGQRVRTGEVIGSVGATGNVTGAHLHMEVHPGGGDAIDPLAWLRGKGLTP